MELLLAHGADIDGGVEGVETSAVFIAARSGGEEALRWLIDRGAGFTRPNSSGWSPLHVAASLGCLERVKILLEAGENTNGLDGDAWTPLHRAAASKSLGCVVYLLEHGADVKLRGCLCILWPGRQ